MKKSYIIILLSLLVVIGLIILSTPRESPLPNVTCVYPTENVIYTNNTLLCLGTYNLTGSAIRIGANNMIIDCNNATIIGNNNSIAIKGVYDGYTNITIKNCNIQDYAQGILVGDGKGWHVHNNNIDCGSIASSKGVQVDVFPYNDRLGSGSYYNNDINNCYYGYYISGGGNDAFYNNIIENTTNALWINRQNKTKIYNNKITNTASNSIRMNNNLNYHNQVYNNTISNSGWNCIDVMGRDSNFIGNYVNNCTHNALNANSDYTDKIYSSNNYIANNIVNNSHAGVYNNNGINMLYENNIFYFGGSESVPKPNVSLCIATDGRYNSTTKTFTVQNLTFKDNYCHNYRTGIFEQSSNANNAFINNKFKNSSVMIHTENYYGRILYPTTDMIINSYYINNAMIDAPSLYTYYEGAANNVIEDKNPLGAYFKLSSSSGLNKTYLGSINMSIKIYGTSFTKEIHFYNQARQTPNNDIKIGNAVIVKDGDDLILSIGEKQIFSVGDYS